MKERGTITARRHKSAGRQPGFVGEIGRRQAFFDAAAQYFHHGIDFLLQQVCIEKWFQSVQRQVQRVQDQVGASS